METNNPLPPCCSPQKKSKKDGLWSGLIYGLIPHSFCILFIVFSIFGSIAGAVFIKKILLLPHLFPLLIALSILFATLSAIFYLRRCSALNLSGIKKNWKYLSILYGTTIFINLLFFLVIFPYTANINFNAKNTPSAATLNRSDQLFRIKVDIPCSGHSPLISDELKKINGVKNVRFKFPNIFEITFDQTLTNQDAILKLEIFKTYAATKIDD